MLMNYYTDTSVCTYVSPSCVIHTGRVHVHKEKRGGQGTFLVYFWVLSEVWYNFILTTPYRTGMVQVLPKRKPRQHESTEEDGLRT